MTAEPPQGNSSPKPEPPPLLEAMRVLSNITTAIILMLVCGGLGYAVDVWAGLSFVRLLGFLAGGALALRFLINSLSE